MAEGDAVWSCLEAAPSNNFIQTPVTGAQATQDSSGAKVP